MRNPLKRYYGDGDLHFVTFSCYRRRAYLGTPTARDRFVEVLSTVRRRFGFRLVGYVVMPEHVHLLLSEAKAADPSRVLQTLKQNVSRALKPATRLGSAPGSTDDSPFWQRRFYDFNVWSSGKVREKLDHMHNNPIERGLTQHPKDWPWSSWSHYDHGEHGLIAIDPAEEHREKHKSEIQRQSQNPHP